MQAAKLGERRVGRYQLLEKIPGGGMTEVYRARVAGSQGPERSLVLKILPAKATGSAEGEARFVEEAKIALALTHGNIVATFEAGRDEAGQLFLVMEYVHGCSLRELLACHGALPLEPALFIARETARALRYTHHYVEPGGQPTPHAHLDVSPENVLLSHAGQVKLTDFGIARAVGAGRTTKVAYGKAAYVAPEVLEGAEGGPPADLYGLGCVIYEMLTGAPPRQGASLEETLALVREDHPILPLREQGFDPEVNDAVMALLEADPTKRGADAGTVELSMSWLLAHRDRPFTEPELAKLLGECGVIEPARKDSSAARLAAQLAEAGTELAGNEGTAELLALGTVPLDPEAAADPAAARSAPGELAETSPETAIAGPRSGGRRRLAGVVAVAGLAALGLALWGGGPWSGVELKIEDPEVGEGKTAGAATAGATDPVEVSGTEPAGGSEGVEPPAGAGGTKASASPEGVDPVAVGVEGERLLATARGAIDRVPGGGAAPTVAGKGAGDPKKALVKEPGGAAGPESGTGTGPGTGPGPDTETGAETVADLEPKMAPPEPLEMARVPINAFPYAEVWTEDGKKLGDTPLREVVLPPGKQRLRLVNRELSLERWVDLDLTPGKNEAVGVRLDR